MFDVLRILLVILIVVAILALLTVATCGMIWIPIIVWVLVHGV